MNRHLYLVLDTETAGTLEEPLVYDIGFAVVDKYGNVYEQYSFVVPEVFFGMPEQMQTAYYAEKIPRYWYDIEHGERKVARFFFIQSLIRDICKRLDIKAIIAHNMRFDNNALNNTTRVLTNGAKKYFLPYNVPIWCTLAMSRSVIAPQSTYKTWCAQNGYVLKNGTPRLTAEILYRFIKQLPDFVESHTGLEDVLIEKDIFAHCVRQHKKMQRTHWKE